MPNLASLYQALIQKQASPTSVFDERFSSIEVLGITHDSRQVQSGWIYVALAGRATHGAHFIPQALERGAIAIAVPRGLDPEMLPHEIPILWLDQPRLEMAWLSEWIWGHPQRSISLIGITGTNGKTTTTTMLADIFERADGDVGLLGTITTKGGGHSEASQMTTLESPAFHQRLASFVKAGIKRCVMEVSSIGICEERVSAARFERAAFLNLSEDHLDYHQDMESYLAAKERLISELLAPQALVVVNLDDPAGERVCQKVHQSGATLWRLSAARALSVDEAQEQKIDVYWQSLVVDAQGVGGCLVTPQGMISLQSPLLGAFNAYNVATAAAIAISLEIPIATIQEGVAACMVSGRMQAVEPQQRSSESKYPRVLVDYAHTPDALTRAIQALRPLCNGRVLCLFGCGGDRDTSKRPLMGRASAHADLVILTSDNPRYEDPNQIIQEALLGCLEGGLTQSAIPKIKTVWCHPDRALAIQTAISMMELDDLLLIAGKGHEPYQEVMGERRAFDDVAFASSALQTWIESDELLNQHLSTTLFCEAAHGTLRFGSHRRLNGGEIDTRRLKSAEAFFCVQGVRDGHDFVLNALEKGAGAIVTRRDWHPADVQSVYQKLEDSGAVWIEVDDPENALRAIAKLYRKRIFRGVLVGLTGSNGKTSTKELLASALAQRGPTWATEGNFNNHLGVPLTLLKLRPMHHYAVIEMGMSARREIELLADLAQPQVGVITTVASAHLEGLGSLTEVAFAKGELFVGLGEQGDAVCASSLPCYEYVLKDVKAKVWHADQRFLLEDLRVSAVGSVAKLIDLETGNQYALNLKLIGTHQLENARLALCAALRAEARYAQNSHENIEDLLRGLAVCPAPAMRGEVSALPVRGSKVSGLMWLDCYNANPQSTLANVRTFWETGLRGVLVLGSLKELGSTTTLLHTELGSNLAQEHRRHFPKGPQPAEVIACVGEEAWWIGEGLRQGGYPSDMILSFDGLDQNRVIESIVSILRASPQASIFVKGSRSGRLEQVAHQLVKALDLDDGSSAHQPPFIQTSSLKER